MTTGYGKNWNPAEHYKNNQIATDYDKARFSSLSGRLFNALEKRLIRKAFSGVPKNASVADVPCGTGRLAGVLLGEGFQVTGIDISKEMLQAASARHAVFGDRLKTVTCDARELEKLGLRFDATLCARVLMHFPLEDQIQFIRGIVKVTSGRIVFTQGLDTPYHRVRRWVKRLLGNQRPAVYPLKRRELETLLRETGLRRIAQYTVLPGLSESVVVVALPVGASL